MDGCEGVPASLIPHDFEAPGGLEGHSVRSVGAAGVSLAAP